ncbi:MAG: GNAT family N-acetyltransferase [Chloroflexota bacterium]
MITDTEIKLRPKELADAQNDYLWQTDPELAGLDASPPLTMSFPQYLADYSRVLRHPSAHRRSFAIETRDGQHIGNCTYYGIDQTSGETEMGIMIGNRDYWDKGYGTRSVAVLLEHIFRQTKLKRVYLKTLE